MLRGVGLEDSRVQGIEVSLAGLAKTYNVRTTPLSKAEREWFYTTLPEDLKQAIPEAQLAYAAEDVKVLADIYSAQNEAFEDRADLQPVVNLEMRVLPALVDVEATGIRINVEDWRAFIAQKAIEAKGHEDKVLETFGEAIVSERIGEYDKAVEEFELWEGDLKVIPGTGKRNTTARLQSRRLGGTSGESTKPQHLKTGASSTHALIGPSWTTARPMSAARRSSSQHSRCWVSRSTRQTPRSSRHSSTSTQPSGP